MFELIPFSSRRFSLYDPFSVFDDWFSSDRSGGRFSSFRTDIREEEDRYILKADLPGCSRENVEVTVEDDRLTISARRSEESGAEDDRGYLRRERSWGSFCRSFDLSAVDADNIGAAYSDGVLTLTLPKKEERRSSSRKLEIQ